MKRKITWHQTAERWIGSYVGKIKEKNQQWWNCERTEKVQKSLKNVDVATTSNFYKFFDFVLLKVTRKKNKLNDKILCSNNAKLSNSAKYPFNKFSTQLFVMHDVSTMWNVSSSSQYGVWKQKNSNTLLRFVNQCYFDSCHFHVVIQQVANVYCEFCVTYIPFPKELSEKWSWKWLLSTN